ncbi:MAG: hypothetical protein ACK4YP_05595, partial [Myxococcota bacterium]
VDYEVEAGVVEVDLTDASGDSNEGQEFFLVVVNTTESQLGYRLRYYDTASAASRPAPPSVRPSATPARAPRLAGPAAAPPPPPSVDSTDIGSARDEFLVRDDLTDTQSYTAVSATLWAVADNVAIWVDDDVPIDWDIDCDGTVDVPDQYDAYGFDNCDLADVADIIDTNIIPNTRSLYGQESDIDGDGRVSVVITPVLNAITRTSDDEEDHARVLSSYAEPNVDLAEFHYRENPGSDEQEVLYVFAPDPYGFFNPDTAPTVESYTGYQLAAEVARSFTTLISYNEHHLLRGGEVEEDWVNDVLGTFAAEYCGFGANYYADAWEYVDAPHLYPLASAAALGSLETLSRGAQYLFGLWLYEQAEASSPGSGGAVLADIVQTDSIGIEAIEAGTGQDFADLVVAWQVALLTSGVTGPDGSALVDPAEWVPYPAAETILAPPASPGGWYGANGYQRGLNLRGTNNSWRYGTTDAPSEIAEKRVKLENTDHYVYTPGYEFVGWMDASYATQVVRLTGITYEQALLELQGSGEGIVGAVVRWTDPGANQVAVENIFSPTVSDAVALPALPADGSVIQGIGQISASTTATSVGSGTSEEIDVADTDRWLLDLTDRSSEETVSVAVWLDRQFVNTSGGVGPDDPWIAVAPRELVPEPSVEGTLRGDSCPGGADFAYPTSLLDHLASQLFLSSTMYDEDSLADFDPCGEQAGAVTSCSTDWDRDGVLDDDEPTPASFVEQALVMQCTQNGNTMAGVDRWYGVDWLDMDEIDEDELATADLVHNAGGYSGPEGEEGYVEVSLQGGREYLIVVGANANGTGTYELSVRQLN